MCVCAVIFQNTKERITRSSRKIKRENEMNPQWQERVEYNKQNKTQHKKSKSAMKRNKKKRKEEENRRRNNKNKRFYSF